MKNALLNVPFVRQKKDWCGPACLKMVLQYYGVKKSQAVLARACKTSRVTGTRAKDIIRVANRFGLQGMIRDYTSWKELTKWVEKRKVPVIVNWFSVDEGHYSVAVHVTPNRIVLHDPEHGPLRAFTRTHFFQVWFGFDGEFLENPAKVHVHRIIALFPKHLKPVQGL